MLASMPLVFAILGPEKPTELRSDIWDADPEKRARNLKLAIAAWKTGGPYVNPDAEVRALAALRSARSQSVHTGPYPIANPNQNAEPPARRPHSNPMRRAAGQME